MVAVVVAVAAEDVDVAVAVDGAVVASRTMPRTLSTGRLVRPPRHVARPGKDEAAQRDGVDGVATVVVACPL